MPGHMLWYGQQASRHGNLLYSPQAELPNQTLGNAVRSIKLGVLLYYYTLTESCCILLAACHPRISKSSSGNLPPCDLGDQPHILF